MPTNIYLKHLGKKTHASIPKKKIILTVPCKPCKMI